METASIIPTWEMAMSIFADNLLYGQNAATQAASRSAIITAGKVLDLISDKGDPELRSQVRDILAHAGLL